MVASGSAEALLASSSSNGEDFAMDVGSEFSGANDDVATSGTLTPGLAQQLGEIVISQETAVEVPVSDENVVLQAKTGRANVGSSKSAHACAKAKAADVNANSEVPSV